MGIKGNNPIALMTWGALIQKYIPPNRDDIEDLKMKNSPAAVLASYIVNTLTLLSDPDLNADWPCYISELPDGDGIDDNIGAVFDVPGNLDGSLARSGEVVQHYGVQLEIRAVDYNTGWRLCEDIALSLDRLFEAEVTVGIVDYIIYNAKRLGPVASLGREEGTKKRNLFSVTYKLTLAEK